MYNVEAIHFIFSPKLFLARAKFSHMLRITEADEDLYSY